jgi:hypothetical protein
LEDESVLSRIKILMISLRTLQRDMKDIYTQLNIEIANEMKKPISGIILKADQKLRNMLNAYWNRTRL